MFDRAASYAADRAPIAQLAGPNWYTSAMTTREALHAKIDVLPQSALDQAAQLLDSLPEDPWLRALRDAPIDDEPLSAAERAEIERRVANIQPNSGVSHADVKRILENAHGPLDS